MIICLPAGWLLHKIFHTLSLSPSPKASAAGESFSVGARKIYKQSAPSARDADGGIVETWRRGKVEKRKRDCNVVSSQKKHPPSGITTGD
jgi:hypothetical protein